MVRKNSLRHGINDLTDYVTERYEPDSFRQNGPIFWVPTNFGLLPPNM